MILNKQNPYISLKKIFMYLAVSYAVLFTLMFLLNPIINYFELKTLFVQNFSYLLPKNVLSSVFNRYFYLIASVGTYLFIRIIIEKKHFSKTILYPQKKSLKYFLIGLTIFPLIKLITILIGMFIGYAKFVSFSESSWNIILSAIALDFAIKISNDIAEEVAFRGYTLNTLTQTINPHAACIISALIFSLIHLINMHPEFLFDQFLFGLLAGYLFIIYKNIYLTIGLHLGANVLTNQLFGYGRIITIDMPSTFTWIMQSTLMIISIGFLINLMKKNKI